MRRSFQQGCRQSIETVARVAHSRCQSLRSHYPGGCRASHRWALLGKYADGGTKQKGAAGEDCAHSLSLSWLTWGQHNPEPVVAAPERRPDVEAERRPAVPAVFAPTAAADHAARARRWTLWISHAPSRVGPIPVPAPLPQVPMHAIQTPRIRLIAPH